MYYRRLKFCIIYLTLNRSYFETVLMKITPRTLGVEILWLLPSFFYIQFFGKNDSSDYVQNCLVLSKNHKEFEGLNSTLYGLSFIQIFFTIFYYWAPTWAGISTLWLMWHEALLKFQVYSIPSPFPCSPLWECGWWFTTRTDGVMEFRLSSMVGKSPPATKTHFTVHVVKLYFHKVLCRHT